jgi:NitT/TauT family transport system substrate-binding protein
MLLQAALTIAVSGPESSPEYLLLRVALAEGEFARAGLSVTLRTTQGEAGAAEALAQGKADLAATSLDAALRHGSADGRPPRLVFGLTAVPPSALLVPTAHRTTVTGIQDLIGKTVGVVSPGAPEESLLAVLLSRFGIRLDQVSQLALGERGVVAALERGEIHAGLVGEPWASRLADEGKAGVLADLRRLGDAERWLGGPTVHAALFARPATPPVERLLSLVRALLNGLDRLETGSAEELAARLPSRVVGLPGDFRHRVAGARAVALPRGWVTAEALQTSVALIRIRSPLPRSIRLPKNWDALLFLDPLNTILEDRRAR